jgi:hypothetical protein
MTVEELRQEYESVWKIRVMNSGGDEIHVDDAFVDVVAAISDLRDRELPYGDLLGLAYTLYLTPVMFAV